MKHHRTSVAFASCAALLLVRPVSADWAFTAVPHQAVHEGDYARMVVDHAGSLHFVLSTFYYASTGDINYHALVGTIWIDEPLWGEYGGIYVSPAFNPGGHLRFLHSRGWKSAGYQLRLASRDGEDWTGWTHAPVAPAGEFPAPCSLAIDAAGQLHAAYVETENGDLMYATSDGTTWTLEQTGEGPDASRDVFIGLSAAGEPRITYIEGSGSLIQLARSGGGWTTRTVYAASSPSEISAIAALTDSAGQLHVALSTRNPGGTLTTRYIRQSGQTFISEIVPVTHTFGRICLALDSAARPGIAYGIGVPAQTSDVRYAKRDDATWDDQPVTSDGLSRLADLAFLPDETPVIAIQRGASNLVMFASPAACVPLCPADFNSDGAATSQDFFDFLVAFFQGSADITHDGQTDSQDFFEFIVIFFGGC